MPVLAKLLIFALLGGVTAQRTTLNLYVPLTDEEDGFGEGAEIDILGVDTSTRTTYLIRQQAPRPSLTLIEGATDAVITAVVTVGESPMTLGASCALSAGTAVCIQVVGTSTETVTEAATLVNLVVGSTLGTTTTTASTTSTTASTTTTAASTNSPPPASSSPKPSATKPSSGLVSSTVKVSTVVVFTVGIIATLL